LADCLIPLLVEDNEEESVEDEKTEQSVIKLETLIHQYTEKFELAYFTMYNKKLGIQTIDKKATLKSKRLINDLLTLMQTHNLDYTQTFLQLTQSLSDEVKAEELQNKLGEWYQAWLLILKDEYSDNENFQLDGYLSAQSLMKKHNPVVIPRNHHIEAVLDICEDVMANDITGMKISTKEHINETVEAFLQVLRSPYKELEMTKKYQELPKDGDLYYQTFCGT
jgi:uncharacterized protein YdiU (UPF0061 family)